MQKRWEIKTQPDAQAVKKLAGELKIDETLGQLLLQRNIRSFNEAKAFFRPEIADLHDPFKMKDMEKAVRRIEEAISNKEKVLIYGDYDVDGTTAVALVYSFFAGFYDQLDFYIPDRYAEGYGVSYQGIDHAEQNGYALIIALDCGIKAAKKVAYAKEKGIDFIICDHHRPDDQLPDAVAVLDPKREDCNYPYDELSGCGIGFKLVQAYAQNKKIAFGKLEKLMDLTAISIACDIVPITGENRVLAYYGLKRLNEQPREGVKTLVELLQVKKALTITDLVFKIGPRINAAGRIDHGKKAVELLISDHPDIAEPAGKNIDEFNTSRKDLDTQITEEALQMIEQDEALWASKTTVLYSKEWHKGVIGIVASRLIEKYYRPTILLTHSNGMATGSARSVKGFDVYNAIEACSDLLEQFGGHKYAAGLTIRPENVPQFQQKFEQVVAEMIEDHMLIPEISIDAELDFQKITNKFFRILKQFAPFGPGNMKPVFVTKRVMNAGYSRQVGKEKDHLKLDVVQPENPDKRMSGIGFGLGHLYPDIAPEGVLFDIVYTLEENEWNGKKTIQMNIKDAKF